MANVMYISAGAHHSAAITFDYGLYTWGYNSVGQLGDGTSTNRNVPTRIMEDVTHVFAGRVNTVAVDTDGVIWGWGCNMFEQLQQGIRTYGIPTPVELFGETVQFDSKE